MRSHTQARAPLRHSAPSPRHSCMHSMWMPSLKALACMKMLHVSLQVLLLPLLVLSHSAAVRVDRPMHTAAGMLAHVSVLMMPSTLTTRFSALGHSRTKVTRGKKLRKNVLWHLTMHVV
jgi:hypothetical protein